MTMRFAGAVLAACLLTAVACSRDVTSPHSSTYAAVIAGGGQRDTIGAALNQALVLQVRGVAQIANQRLQLVGTGPVNESPNGGSCYLYFAPLDTNMLTCYSTVQTDSRGQVEVAVSFANTVTTAAAIVATVLDSTGSPIGSPDTVHFTIDPGNATGVTASPADTAMFAGATLPLHGFAHDRAGNARTDLVSYGPTSGPITVSASKASATATGRAWVLTRSGAFADTTHLSVVPEGTIAIGLAYHTPSGLAILGLDGSGYRFLMTSVPTTDLAWAPNAASIVFDDVNGNEVYHQTLQILDTTGTQHQADTTALASYANEWGGQYTRDGQWLYFARMSMVTGVAFSQIWRVGSDAAAVAVSNNAPAWDYAPSPSPDGTTLAYASSTGYGYLATIKLLNLATGAVTNTGITGDSPRWAPNGQMIAFVAGNTLSVMQSDGSNVHAVGPAGNIYELGMDWSPDGHWLVAINASTGHVDVINVQSNIALPLAFTTQLSSVTWRPTAH